VISVGGALLLPVRRIARAWRTTRRTAGLVPEALEAILMLPRLSEQLEVVCFQTATLAELRDELARVHADTRELRPINDTLGRMAVTLDRVDANTVAVEQLADVMLPLQGAARSVGRAADRWRLRRPGRDTSLLT
jgi:hypothetical protein